MFWTIVFLVSIAQGVFLLSLLFGLGSKNSVACRLIAFIVFAMVVTNLDYLLVVAGVYRAVPFLFGVSFGMMFLFGPLFYFYARSVTEPDFAWRRQYYLHFVPYLLNVILNVPFWLIDTHTKTLLIESFLSGALAFDAFSVVMSSAQSFHLFVYLLLTLRRTNSTELSYGNMTFIVSMNRRLAWLRSMFACFAIFLATVVVLLVFILIKQTFVAEANYLYTVITSATIYIVAYQLVLNPNLINPDFEKKYGSSKPFDDLTAERHLGELDSLFQEKKIHLNAELKLSDVAGELALPPHLVSKLINEKLGKSFNDLVNEHRVQEFVSRVNYSDNKKESLLAVAYAVGFNSKSAFNSAFKKITGKRPSEMKEGRK